MKKKILSILPLLLLSVVLVHAQTGIATPEPTSYRGAFAPAPTPMWTENWTNWDPQNTTYRAATVTLSGVLPCNRTLSKDTVYKLSGLVFVDSLCTLTIEAGTVLRGDETVQNSSLVVQRGATLIANGTPCNPIVFTSNKAVGARAKADWGGVIILGRARHNLGVQNAIEGIATTDPNYSRIFHGGTNDSDNSGILRYMRIEYGGFVFSPNNEINGLTMGSVGNGTIIDYVQTSFINDDSFEWFGGSVNCKHLVAYRGLDDDFDTDNGFSGTVQFGLGIKDPAISDDPLISTSEGFESDNNNVGSPAFPATPKTSVSFYNITQIGAFRCTSNSPSVTQPSAVAFRRGARFRRNTEMKIFNSILMNNWRGLTIDSVTLTNSGKVFRNNIIAMDFTTVWTAPYAGVAIAAENTGLPPGGTNTTAILLNLAANTNTIIGTPCDVLTRAWNFTNPDYRPNSTFGSSGAALSGCDLAPGIQISNGLFIANATSEVLVDVFENSVGNSNGTITITIPVLSGWTYALIGGPALTATPTLGTSSGTSLGNSGNPFDNRDWNFSIVGAVNGVGGNLVATSKVGYSIPSGGSASIGITAKRNSTTPNGTNQNLSATVSGGSDIDGTNNSSLTGLAAIQ